jgi:hypothetical protein
MYKGERLTDALFLALNLIQTTCTCSSCSVVATVTHLFLHIVPSSSSRLAWPSSCPASWCSCDWWARSEAENTDKNFLCEIKTDKNYYESLYIIIQQEHYIVTCIVAQQSTWSYMYMYMHINSFLPRCVQRVRSNSKGSSDETPPQCHSHHLPRPLPVRGGRGHVLHGVQMVHCCIGYVWM